MDILDTVCGCCRSKNNSSKKKESINTEKKGESQKELLIKDERKEIESYDREDSVSSASSHSSSDNEEKIVNKIDSRDSEKHINLADGKLPTIAKDLISANEACDRINATDINTLPKEHEMDTLKIINRQSTLDGIKSGKQKEKTDKLNDGLFNDRPVLSGIKNSDLNNNNNNNNTDNNNNNNNNKDYYHHSTAIRENLPQINNINSNATDGTMATLDTIRTETGYDSSTSSSSSVSNSESKSTSRPSTDENEKLSGSHHSKHDSKHDGHHHHHPLPIDKPIAASDGPSISERDLELKTLKDVKLFDGENEKKKMEKEAEYLQKHENTNTNNVFSEKINGINKGGAANNTTNNNETDGKLVTIKSGEPMDNFNNNNNNNNNRIVNKTVKLKDGNNIKNGSIETATEKKILDNHKIVNYATTPRVLISQNDDELFRHLAPLSDWMQKKSDTTTLWHKKWVMVKDGYFLWNNNEISKFEKDARNKMKHGLSLRNIKKVRTHHGKKHTKKFDIITNVDELHLKAPDTQTCNKWVKGMKLRLHILAEQDRKQNLNFKEKI